RARQYRLSVVGDRTDVRVRYRCVKLTSIAAANGNRADPIPAILMFRKEKLFAVADDGSELSEARVRDLREQERRCGTGPNSAQKNHEERHCAGHQSGKNQKARLGATRGLGRLDTRHGRLELPSV